MTVLTMPQTVDEPGAATQVGKRPKEHVSGVTVIFDFGHGHMDRRGKSSGNYSQSDVVDEYGRCAVDEMEADNVRLFHVETRKPPGCREDLRIKLGPETFIPLVFSCDYTDSARALHNMSVVEYQGAHYLDLATRLCEGMTEWGRCYVWGHRVAKPVQVTGDGRDFIRIKPFALNGPHEADYLRRLNQLGQSVGRAVGQYLIDRREGRRVVTSTLRY